MTFRRSRELLALCLFLWTSSKALADTAPDYSGILFQKTTQNGSRYNIDQVSGDMCCSSCLWLPSLRPCAAFPVGVTVDNRRVTLAYSDILDRSRTLCHRFVPNFAGYDQLSLCIQNLDEDSENVEFTYMFDTTSFHNNPDARVTLNRGDYYSPLCANDVSSICTRGVNTLPQTWEDAIIFYCNDDDKVSLGLVQQYSSFTKRQVITKNYFPLTIRYAAANVSTIDAFLSIWRNAGRHTQSFIWRYPVPPTGTLGPISVYNETRCNRSPVCFDDLAAIPDLPSSGPSSICQFAPGDYYAVEMQASPGDRTLTPYFGHSVPGHDVPVAACTDETAKPTFNDRSLFDIGVYCDAPKSNNKVCNDNSVDISSVLDGNLNTLPKTLGVKRGCAGWGFCPWDYDNLTCGGNGTCLNSGKCYCNDGWGGLACDIALPTLHNYTCSDFDPCSEQGWCQDTPRGPTCLCYTGWRGSIADGDNEFDNAELNLYLNTFVCGHYPASEPCPANRTQVAYAYMKDHQCLFFIDDMDNSLVRRYLRTSSHIADKVFDDRRFATESRRQAYTYTPLWYNGSADPQLTGRNGDPVWGNTYDSTTLVSVTQVVARGYNCIDGRTVWDKTTLPIEDQPLGKLRGGPGCEICPNCYTNQSKCVQLDTFCFRSWLDSTAVLNVFQKMGFYDPCRDYMANHGASPSVIIDLDCSLWGSVIASQCNSASLSSSDPVLASDLLPSLTCTVENPQVFTVLAGALMTRLPDPKPTVSALAQDLLYLFAPTKAKLATEDARASWLLSLSTENQTCTPYDGHPPGYCDTCVHDKFSIQRKCDCFPNFNHSDPSNPICDATICPFGNFSLPCGGPDRGTCVNTGGTSPYLGYCMCKRGYSGIDCSVDVCPSTSSTESAPPSGLGPNLMCGGFVASAPSDLPANQTSGRDIPPALDCDMVMRRCICNEPWWRYNSTSGLCDAVGCPTSSVRGLECNGLVRYGTTTGVLSNNVCDRNPINGLGVCQCTKARASIAIDDGPQTNVSFYGAACDIPYSTVCTHTNTSSQHCSGLGLCYVDGTDPIAAPRCHCNSGQIGSFCESSACDVTARSSFDACAVGRCRAMSPKSCTPETCATYDNCPNPNDCHWACECSVVNVNNLATTCSPTSANVNCTYFSKVDPSSPMSPPGISCQYEVHGCTYFDPRQGINGKWTICGKAGVSACVSNDTTTFCQCPSAYSGTYCETSVGCSGYCDKGSTGCSGGDTPSSQTCSCDEFHIGETKGNLCNATVPCCNISTCANTYDYPGNLTSTGDHQDCTCPLGSSYKSFKRPTPSSCGQLSWKTFKGCSLDCPSDALGFECGGCAYDNNKNPSRCSSYTTIYGHGTAPTCDCSLFGKDYWLTLPTAATAVRVPFTNASDGTCEPYCSRIGGTYIIGSLDTTQLRWTQVGTPSGYCQCRYGFTGPRCNISVLAPTCANGGVVSYAFQPPKCMCGANGTADFPYSSESNCTELVCDASTSVYNTTYSLTKCKCYPPYGYANSAAIKCTNVCANGGLPNTTSRACNCFKPWYGTYCDQTDCVNGSPTSSSCVCYYPFQRYDNVTGRCVNRTCVHGAVDDNGVCRCLSKWTGDQCEIDACAIAPSYGVATLTSGSYVCQCLTGYKVAPDGFCTIDHCGSSGKPVRCGGSTGVQCATSSSPYNCLCGNGTVAFDSSFLPYCIPPTATTCVHGKLTQRDSQLWCTCDLGWSNNAITGVMCNVYQCDTDPHTNIFFNETTQQCECYRPFSGPPTCTDYQTLCGPGSTTPTLASADNDHRILLLGTILKNPLMLYSPVQFHSPSFTCNCLSGYVVAEPYENYYLKDTLPCVKNCSMTGTLLRTIDSCICLPLWTGELCSLPDEIIRIVNVTSHSSSSGLPDWGIGLIAGLGSALVIGGISLAIIQYFRHKDKPKYSRAPRSERIRDSSV